MKLQQWKDATSYSQGEKDRTPRSWELQLGCGRVLIHRHIDHRPDQWLLSFHDFGFVNHPLLAVKAEDAQQEALALIIDHLQGVVNEVQGVFLKGVKRG